MVFWRRSDGIEDQLRAAKAEPSRDTLDSITAHLSAHRPRTRSRVAAALVLAVVSVAGVLALGGVGYATDAVQNVVSPSGNTQSSSDCTVEFPCTFTLNATPKDNKLDGTDATKGNTQIHVPGGAPQAVTLSMTFTNACTNAAASGFTYSFADNPLPQGQDKTDFTVTTTNVPAGIYTVTVTGTSGTQSASDSFTIRVGGATKC
jgi:PKD repeat protein